MSQTILVVDDDRDFIELIHSVLEIDGYEVIGCPNSGSALAMMQRHSPTLIFLDLYMPPPTGWDILKAIREDATLASIPVLIVSALDGESNENERLPEPNLAPFDVLTKPFEIDELVARVHRLLQPTPPDSILCDPYGERTAPLL